VHVAFIEPFSLAKVEQTGNTPKNVNYSETNFAQNLPQIHESGYSTKFLAEFLGLAP
jgi:hypothetical protein